MASLVYGQSSNYEYFIKSGREAIEKAQPSAAPVTDAKRHYVELAKACALLAEACKENA